MWAQRGEGVEQDEARLVVLLLQVAAARQVGVGVVLARWAGAVLGLKLARWVLGVKLEARWGCAVLVGLDLTAARWCCSVAWLVLWARWACAVRLGGLGLVMAQVVGALAHHLLAHHHVLLWSAHATGQEGIW